MWSGGNTPHHGLAAPRPQIPTAKYSRYRSNQRADLHKSLPPQQLPPASAKAKTPGRIRYLSTLVRCKTQSHREASSRTTLQIREQFQPSSLHIAAFRLLADSHRSYSPKRAIPANWKLTALACTAVYTLC